MASVLALPPIYAEPPPASRLRRLLSHHLAGDEWFAGGLAAGIVAMVASLYFIGSSKTTLVLFVAIPCALALLSVTNTRRAVLLFFAYCAVEGLFKTMSQYNPVVHVGRDLVLGAIIGGAALRRVVSGQRFELNAPSRPLILLFATACLVQIANPQSVSLMASIAALRFQLAAIPLYFMGYHLFTTKEHIRGWLWLSVLVAAVLAVVAVMQYVEGAAWTNDVFPGSASFVHSPLYTVKGIGQVWRPPSTTGDGGGASNWVPVAVPFAFALTVFASVRRAFRMLIPALLLVAVMGLIVSSVRQMAILSILEAGLCLVLVLGTVGRRALMPVLIGMSLAVLIGWRLLGASNVPAEARFAILQNPFQAYEVQRARNLPVIIEDLRYLPLGAGLGRTGAASAEFAADIRDKPLEGFESGFENSETFFAGELSETGIPGTLLILLITAVFLKRGWTVFHNTQDRELKATAGALLAMLIALAVSYFGGPTLYTPPFNTYFWFAGGLLARIALMDQELQQKPAAAAAA